LAETFSASTGIPLQLEPRLGDERLPPEVETTLYRVVQESLTNVAKHAGARKVSVLLVRRGSSVAAVIEDDGHGFTPDDEQRGGIDALPKLLHEAPDAKVLVLSMQDDPQYVREAFAAGAKGYVLKEAADADVVDAIRQVAAGGSYVHPTLGARMVAAEAAARAA